MLRRVFFLCAHERTAAVDGVLSDSDSIRIARSRDITKTGNFWTVVSSFDHCCCWKNCGFFPRFCYN